VIERLVEVRRVTARFPTGEVRTTAVERLAWVTDAEEAALRAPEVVVCPPSSDVPGPWIRTRRP
jgi:hypothetical protein